MQFALGDAGARASSISATYVLSWSERRWAGEWVPWSQDRRHLLRALGQLELSPRWSLFGAVEFASGVPVTPVDAVAVVGSPGPGGGGIERSPRGGEPVYIFDAENSRRGGGTARLDVGANYAFGGRGRVGGGPESRS